MLLDLKLYFDENQCCAPTQINSDDFQFNYDTFQRILSDLHSNPCKVMELGNKDIKNVMELTTNQIKLKKNIAIIYSRLRLLGFF